MPVDSCLFLNESITSREYVLRYADDVVHDQQELLAAFAVADADELEDE